jgi:hypothetical protein
MAARSPPPVPPPPPDDDDDDDDDEAAAEAADAPAAPAHQQQPDVDGLAHYAALGFDDGALDRLRRAGCDPAARLAAVSAADVRAAWRRAARRLHPDKQQQRPPGASAAASSAAAAAAFVRARRAYDVLGDARARRAYDLLGAEAGLAAARAAGAEAAAGGGGGGGKRPGRFDGGWARGAAGAVPVTVWYGDEEGDDALAAAAAAAQEADMCVEDLTRRLMLEAAAAGEEEEEQGPGVGAGAAALAGPQQQQPLLDPSRQLALLCELCPRPASRACWTCGASLCAFCSRRPHYALHGAPLYDARAGPRRRRRRGGSNNSSTARRPPRRGLVPAHYPLVDAPGSVAEALGRQEWEQKRLEDARRAVAARPGHRPEAERRALHEFLDGGRRGGEEEDEGRGGGRYYRWSVARGGGGGGLLEARVAVFLPTGGGGGGGGGDGGGSGDVRVELEGGGHSAALLSVYTPGAPRRVLDRRRLALPLSLSSSSGGVEVRTLAGGRAAVVRLPLAAAPHLAPSPSARLFDGDEPGARRRWPGPEPPLYSIVDEPDDDGDGDQQGGGGGGGGVRVVFEGLLPWWVDAREDVDVDCFFRGGGGGAGAGAGAERGRLGLRVRVGGVIDVRRTYSREAAAALGDEARAAWWCEEDEGGGRAPGPAGAAAPPSPGKKKQQRTLSVFVPLRPPTREERAYRAGVRQDHRAAARRESPLAPWLGALRRPSRRRAAAARPGVALFEEDEDEFGLDALLDAVDDAVDDEVDGGGDDDDEDGGEDGGAGGKGQ